MKLVMFAFFIVNLSSCSALLLGGVSVVETMAKKGRPTCKEIEEVCSIDKILEASLKERDIKNSATDWSVGVSTAPSSTYENFAKAEQIFSHTKSKECLELREKIFSFSSSSSKGPIKTDFAREWEFQKTLEQERLANMEKLKQHNEEQYLAREAHKREVVMLAKKYKIRDVIFDVGLTDVINSLLAGEITLSSLKRVAIELDDRKDASLAAFQVPKFGEALYGSDYTDAVIWLKDYRETLFQHAPLTVIRNHYVTIESVKNYQTLLGSNQAILIKTAW